jgi:hypothetical protein
MLVEYDGVDEQLGSTTHWIGSPEVGEGEQETIKIAPFLMLISNFVF